MVRFLLSLVTIVYGIFSFYCILYVPDYTDLVVQVGIFAYLIVFPGLILIYYVLLKCVSYFIKDLHKEEKK